MTVAPPRRARPPRRPTRFVWPAAAGVAIFLVGLAIGRSLSDNPIPGGTQTIERTLQPLQLAPAARSTVTVTVSKP